MLVVYGIGLPILNPRCHFPLPTLGFPNEARTLASQPQLSHVPRLPHDLLQIKRCIGKKVTILPQKTVIPPRELGNATFAIWWNLALTEFKHQKMGIEHGSIIVQSMKQLDWSMRTGNLPVYTITKMVCVLASQGRLSLAMFSTFCRHSTAKKPPQQFLPGCRKTKLKRFKEYNFAGQTETECNM